MRVQSTDLGTVRYVAGVSPPLHCPALSMQRFTTMARPLAALLALLATSLLALPAEAQWKWKDKGGHVQYSDLPPPPGTAEQEILGRPSGPRRAIVQSSPAASAASNTAVVAAGASAAASRPADAELEAKRKKAEADQAAKVKAEEAKVAAARSENCARAKGQMRSLDSGVRIVRTNEKGEREFLDDKQRADETKHTRDVIAADCK